MGSCDVLPTSTRADASLRSPNAAKVLFGVTYASRARFQSEPGLMTLLYIAAGGAVGSVARYALSTVIQQRAAGPFPLGTLVVNVTGSFLLGLLMRYGLATPAFSPEVRAL
jgi:hypothetical protein